MTKTLSIAVPLPLPLPNFTGPNPNDVERLELLEKRTRKAFKSFTTQTKILFLQRWLDDLRGDLPRSERNAIERKDRTPFRELLNDWNAIKKSIDKRVITNRYDMTRSAIQFSIYTDLASQQSLTDTINWFADLCSRVIPMYLSQPCVQLSRKMKNLQNDERRLDTLLPVEQVFSDYTAPVLFSHPEQRAPISHSEQYAPDSPQDCYPLRDNNDDSKRPRLG